MNFFVDLHDVSKDNAKIVLSWGVGEYARTNEVPLSEQTPNASGYYTATARVAAAQMTETIRPAIYKQKKAYHLKIHQVEPKLRPMTRTQSQDRMPPEAFAMSMTTMTMRGIFGPVKRRRIRSLSTRQKR